MMRRGRDGGIPPLMKLGKKMVCVMHAGLDCITTMRYLWLCKELVPYAANVANTVAAP